MRIFNNLPATKTFNSLNRTNKKLAKTLNSLSTGLRINSSSDDAAGFAISQKMRSQISGLNVAMRNSQDGISLLQTAEGALGESNSMLQRMRELAVQASNDSLTSNDRQYIQLEINELKKQIDKISNTTQFNRKRILDGSSGALWSSSDINVKARINGGLTRIDEFGQKVSSEGNYRIEISAEGGRPQVQKSNIFKVSYEEVVTRTETVQNITGYTTPEPYEININDGLDTLGNASGTGWDFRDGQLTITGSGKYCIVGDTTPTTNHIFVNPGVNATIFLRDVNVDTTNSQNYNWSASAGSAFFMQDATVDIYLDGENSFTSGGGWHSSGIEASGNSKLTISSISGDFSTNGTLRATGSLHGAGIGGSCASMTADCGEIIIKGGTIEVQGGDGAAGIGGGNGGGPLGGTAKKILIEGGNVTANGGIGGAGIGSGGSDPSYAPSNNNSQVIIKGGTVVANGGNDYLYVYSKGAGIGGGSTFDSGHIEISPNASVTTTGYVEAGQTESIGCGEGGTNRDVNNPSLTPSAPRTVPSLPMTDPEPITEEEVIVTETITTKSSTLSDMFRNPNGVSLIERPQTITITQGDGKTANVTLYETDTMEDIAEKINDAISDSLGQGKYTNNTNKFCTISDGTQNTSESIFTKELIKNEETEEEMEIAPGSEILSGTVTTSTNGYNVGGTMLIRSAIPGKSGELYFSGDEDLLKALGLNTIQEAQDATYTASVYNAHSGEKIATNVKSSEPEFPSLIPPEIDIEVDLMSGLSANWDENTKRFIMARKDVYTTFLHLKDNGTIFQIGANGGEDFSVQLGDTSCNALGISKVNVATRETASKAIGIIDKAITKISSQRAKIGAYENSLEYNIEELSITSSNLTNSESRIRDADMAKTMMNFVKLQILNQSGISMLAQSNQLPNSVLKLMQ